MKLKARGFDGSAEARRRIEKLATPRDGTWSMLPASAVRDRSLGPCSPLHVLAWLCKYRNTKTGEAFPSIERMAHDLGITARSVQRHMEKLIECGHVVVLPRLNSMGKQTSNSYFVLYGDVQASPDREGPAQTKPSAGESPKAPGEPLMASDAGVTCSVTPDQDGVTQDVTPKPETAPARGDTPCRGGVTQSVARGDAQCHPNYPTASIPLNDPFAEANARTRARAAAGHEGNEDSGEGNTETLPAETPSEARQNTHIKIPNKRSRPPRVMMTPLDALLQQFIRKSRKHSGEVQVAMLGWLADLEAAGLSSAEAERFVVDKGNLWIDAFEDNDPMEDVAAEVRGHIDDLKLKVA